jgi:hypothetical protein
MQIEKIGDRIVVECQHCLGTTQCQHAVHFHQKSDSYRFDHWLCCPRCGEGYHMSEEISSFDDPPALDPSLLHRPVCSVCDGRGFIVV